MRLWVDTQNWLVRTPEERLACDWLKVGCSFVQLVENLRRRVFSEWLYCHLFCRQNGSFHEGGGGSKWGAGTFRGPWRGFRVLSSHIINYWWQSRWKKKLLLGFTISTFILSYTVLRLILCLYLTKRIPRSWQLYTNEYSLYLRNGACLHWNVRQQWLCHLMLLFHNMRSINCQLKIVVSCKKLRWL